MKQTVNSAFMFIAALIFSASAVAETAQAQDEALIQLVEKLGRINTFSGTFVQYSVDQKGARIQESRGELKADRAGLFYWHTSEPLEQTVVSNGKEVTVYDPDLEQATIQAVGQQAQTTPAILFSGDTAEIGKNFNVEKFAQVYSFWLFLQENRARNAPYLC